MVVSKPEHAVLGNRTANRRAVLVLLVGLPWLVVLVQLPRVRVELVILEELVQRALDFVGPGVDQLVEQAALGGAETSIASVISPIPSTKSA